MDKIKILHLEDTQTDAEQIHRVLKNAKLNFEPLVVDTREEYIKALNKFMPDVFISDHSLPAFNSFEALDILIEQGYKVPFILVTGAVSEEFAAEAMKKGADDYILKDRPHRLPAAVLNAVQKHRLNKRLHELQHEHEYLASIVNYSDDAIISKDLDGTIKSWNKSAERIFGYTASEMIGKNIAVIIPNNKQGEDKKILAKIANGEVVDHYETMRVSKSGKPIHVSITTSPIKNAEGKIVGVSKISRDISEQKKKEEELLETKNQYEELVTNLSAAVYTCDAEGRILMFNKAAEELWGRAPKVGKDLWCGSWKIFDNSGNPVPLDTCPMAITLKTGKPANGQEIVIQRPDGETRRVLPNPVPTFNLKGELTGAINLLIDMTSLRLAEESIRQSEANLRQIIDLIPHLIFVKDETGKFIEVNKRFAELYGFTDKNKLIGSKIYNSAPDPSQGISIMKEDLDVLQAGVNKIIPDKVFTDYKGDEFIFHTTKVPYIVAGTGQKAVLGIAIDVTDAKAMEEELRAEKTKLNSIINNMNAGVVVADTAGNFILFNGLASELLGTGPTDSSVEEWPEKYGVFYEDRVTLCPYHDLPLVKAINGERIEQQTLFIKNANKPQGVFLNFTGSAIPDANGNTVAGAVVLRDVTELVTANEKLNKAYQDLIAEQHRLKLLESVITNTKDSVIITEAEPWDKPGPKILYVNEAFTKMTGYSAEEVIGRNPRILQGPKTDKKELKRLRAALERWEPCEITVINYKKNGEEFWINFSISPVANEKGWFTHWISIERDVTESKQAELKLQQSHELIQKLTDQVPLAVYQFEMTPAGKMSFPFMGKGIERILPGMTAEEVKADSSTPFAQIHPDDLPNFLVSIEHSRQNLSTWEQEYRSLTDTGEIKWMLASSRPEKREDGTVVWFGFIQDITERKKAEEKIHFDANLLNIVGEAIIATDINGAIIYWNKSAQKIYGWSEKEVLGRNVVDVTPAQISIEVGKEIMNQLASGKTWSGEYLVQRKDGSEFWAFVSDFPVHNDKGELIAIMGVSRDITEEKRVEDEIRALNENLEERVEQRTAELIEANTALEAFSYSVSHDLRSPVRALIGFSSIIRKEYEKALSPEMKELFSHIESSGKRMNAIIDDLLTLARFGKEKLKLAPVDMNKLFSNAIDPCIFSAEHKATFNLQPLPYVIADASMLEQVIVNLVSNALKYSSKAEKPHIQIGNMETESGHTFFIKDNGAGFDMKQYERLFGAFQRLHGSSEFEGTGVGLTLVKRIIEKHNGRVWAEGKVNEGATFYFSLPK